MAIGISLSFVFKSFSGADSDAPVLSTARVGHEAGPDVIELIYGEPLDATSVPATGAFSLGGTSETVSSVAISGRTVSLTLSDYISAADTITVSYTAGASPIRDAAENNAANLTNQAVTNLTGYYWIVDPYGTVILDPHGNAIPTF